MSQWHSAFAAARHTAHQLHLHADPMTALALVKAHWAEFEPFEIEPKTAAAMVSEHLARLASDGIAMALDAPKRGVATAYRWAIENPTGQPSDPDRNAKTDPALGHEQSELDLRQPDCWDDLGRQIAQACREQSTAGLRIVNLATKLHVLDRLASIASDDISEVLEAISNDLRTIGGDS